MTGLIMDTWKEESNIDQPDLGKEKRINTFRLYCSNLLDDINKIKNKFL